MSKLLAMIALAVGIVAIAAGSAFAGCGGMQTAHGTSLETQTASTDAPLPQTPKPESSSN